VGQAAISCITKYYNERYPLLVSPELHNLPQKYSIKQNIVNLEDRLTFLPPPSVRKHVKTMKISFMLSLEFTWTLSAFFRDDLDSQSLKLFEIKIFIIDKISERTLSELKALPIISVHTEELRESLRRSFNLDFSPQLFALIGLVSDDTAATVILPKFTVLSDKDLEVKEHRYTCDLWMLRRSILSRSSGHGLLKIMAR
jgi:hypothetical protein